MNLVISENASSNIEISDSEEQDFDSSSSEDKGLLEKPARAGASLKQTLRVV